MNAIPPNRYSDYFQSINASHGDLPAAEFRALLARQVEAIRAQLVSSNCEPSVIEAEVKLAQAAASDVVEPPVARKAFAWYSDKGLAVFKKRPLTILGVLFALAYVSVLWMFLTEGHPGIVITDIDAQATPIEAHFIAIDFVRETATMTLTPMMSSPLVAARGKLIADVLVEIDTGASVLTHTFKGGDAPVPWIAIIPVEEGDQLEYPFDVHSGDFHIKASRKGVAGSVANLDIDKITHGFRMNAVGEPTSDKTELNVAYQIRRSPSVIFLALIAMLSLGLVVLSAVNVAVQVAVHGRKVEFSMMVWIAALLFVVPTVRNGLPGGPPPGAFVDIVLFFWLHVLIVGALLTVVWNWSQSQ